jgi:hypothetical protein
MAQPARSTGDPAVLEFLSKHPGGFDIDFFETFLPQHVYEYAAHRGGLDSTTMEVVFVTANGMAYPIVAARVSFTWVMIFTEDDQMVFLPHDQVIAVIVRRRQGPAPKKAIGFTVERADQGSDASHKDTS